MLCTACARTHLSDRLMVVGGRLLPLGVHAEEAYTGMR